MADSHSYFLVARVQGPAWDRSRPMRRQRRWAEHASFMDDLAATGFVLLGGPVDEGRRIVLVCDASDEETVRSRLAGDPWSLDGMLELASVGRWTMLLYGCPVRPYGRSHRWPAL
jgi:hypothetical protein